MVGVPTISPPRRRRAADPAPVVNGIRRVVQAIRTAAEAADTALGLSGAQHFVMECLAREPGLSLNGLAARTFTHKSSVSVVIARLVQRGFVRRRVSPADARALVLDLTADGRRALGRLPDSPQTRMIAALGRMGARDVRAFGRLFDRFCAELGMEAAPPMLGEPSRRRTP